ncbi:putative transporter [Blastopirellula marina]|uniref:Putative transporter n=2 Tax=Blastopirellula marina TaxID=124 RepID=A0A2S8G1L0_9BACT|nr:putative transporter [Blastopirellula marina]PTL44985.1 putative transporter [Blastopirellula marina]
MGTGQMNWLLELAETNPTAQAFAVISLVCMLGMVLGSFRFKGIGLGTSGVLFAGIIVGNFSKPIDHHTLDFLKELGLVLFVFCIGLQLGPGFFASLRKMGLQLNLLAATIVGLGAAVAVGMGWIMGLDNAAILGLFSGATTNTPSLGAAQQTLSGMENIPPEQMVLPAMAYAVAYPFAVVGIIGTLLVLKSSFGIDPHEEAKEFETANANKVEPLSKRTFIIDNPNLEGVAIGSVPGRIESPVTVSRIRRSQQTEVEIATSTTTLSQGDTILAVGTQEHLDQYQRVVGHAINEDLASLPGKAEYRKLIVTNSEVLGKTIEQLGLEQKHGVVVTRIVRGDLELTPVHDLRLKFGDVVRLVGRKEDIKRASALLGNSVNALNATHFVPFFAGIAAGIALGTMPINVPGLPEPLRLGLAGGPLLVAILVGRLGQIGPLVWHMPRNANLAIREFGIALFFASVGLMAGPKFFSVVFSPIGLQWLLAGALVTLIPLITVGLFARCVLRMNFVAISGLFAGSMTDPPALTFATNICQAESPAVTYAAVYPLTMVLRIMTVQILAVLFFG